MSAPNNRSFWKGTPPGLRDLLKKRIRQNGRIVQDQGPDLKHIRNFAANPGAAPSTTEGPYSRLLPGLVYADADIRPSAAKPAPKKRPLPSEHDGKKPGPAKGRSSHASN